MLVCLLLSGKSVWSQNAGDVWDEYSIDKPKGRVVVMTYKDYDEVYSFGEVSEVKRKLGTTIAYFNKNGLVCYERIIDGAKHSEISYLYDGGKLMKRIKTQPKATESGVSYDTIAVRTYTYDDSGRMKTRSDWENNTLTSKDRFEYTPTGYIMYCYKGDGSLDRTFERKGNTLSSSVKNGQKVEYVFDDDGRLIRQSVFLGATNGFGGVSVYIDYNQYGDGMCVYRSVGSSLRNNKKAMVYTRQPNGNVVANLEDQYSDELRTKATAIFKYEYDSKNNWIVQSNVTKKTRVVREIVYAKSDNDFVNVEHTIETTRRSLDSVLYEENVLAQRRIKEKEKATAAAKAKEIAETYREKQALAADQSRRAALAKSRCKKIKAELMMPYYAEYPYICKATWRFGAKLSIHTIDMAPDGSISLQGSDCIFDPVDEHEKRVKYYIGVQQTIIRSLNDKGQKKDCKTLERSLKKAETDKQRVNLLEVWLKGRGYDFTKLPTDNDPRKAEQLNLYHDYDEKLKTMGKESVIADTGRDYIVWRLGGLFLKEPFSSGKSNTNFTDISLEHIDKCVEVQKFVCLLLQDAEQKKELEEKLKYISRKYPKYTNSTAKDTQHTMLFLTFENYLTKHGIAIPQK